MRFGDYAPAGSQANLDIEDGEHQAIVSGAELVMDGSKPKMIDNDKYQSDVTFLIDRDHSVRRRFTISYYPSAPWVEFLSATMGIAATDEDALRDVTDQELKGQRCRVVVKSVTKAVQGGTMKTYKNVDSVLPPRKGAAPAPGQRPTERLHELAQQATTRPQRPARPVEPEPEPEPEDELPTECVSCGATLYEGDIDKCADCVEALRSQEVPF